MTKKILVTLFATVIVTTVSIVYADWSAPTATPPNGNTPAPVNVGNLPQDKKGVLTLGGLGVFGSALITPTGSYTLPTNLNLGVNGKVGATAYCDQNGNNCVTTLGGTVTSVASNSSNSSSGTQMVSGWPNKIFCESGKQKSALYINGVSDVGFPETRVTYTSFADVGAHTQLQFNYATGDYLSRAATTDGYAKAVDACVAKGNIKNQKGFN